MKIDKLILVFFMIANLAIGKWFGDARHNTPVCLAENEQQFPDLISDQNGGAIIVWMDARNENRDLYAQRISENGEKIWGENDLPICVLPKSQGWGVILENGITVWRDSRNGNPDLYAQRISENGDLLWKKNGVAVCVDDANQDDLRAISDGDGGVIVAWEDWRNGDQDLYAQKLNSNGKAIWIENGVPIIVGDGDQYDAMIADDGNGGAIFVWWDVNLTEWKIFAQRIDSNGEKVWNENGVAICSAEGFQGGPAITSDGDGGAFIVWSDHRNDPTIVSSPDLYAQRISAEGEILWGNDGVPICVHSANQQQATIIRDDLGNLIVTWWDERDVFADIYAQKIDPNGIPIWEKDGIPICVAGGVQRQPQIISDSENGIVIYWIDYREDYGDVTRSAIYAQRIDQNGHAKWQMNGVPICTADGDRVSPNAVLASDGSILIVWSDGRREDPYDIFIEKITLDGDLKNSR